MMKTQTLDRNQLSFLNGWVSILESKKYLTFLSSGPSLAQSILNYLLRMRRLFSL